MHPVSIYPNHTVMSNRFLQKIFGGQIPMSQWVKTNPKSGLILLQTDHSLSQPE